MTGRLLLLLVTFSLSNIIFAQNRCNEIVTLDNFYNHEVRKNGLVWHYTWDDTSMGGFSQLGELFIQAGGRLNTLTTKPNRNNLKSSKVYIIVDPDTESESPSPNYMDEEAAQEIMAWVRKGGKLVLFTNDKGNCDLHKINILSEKAGIHFNECGIKKERPVARGEKRNFDDCAFTEFTEHPIFCDVKKLFLKEICTINCSESAKGILTIEDGKIVMAQANVGKGIILAIADPWLYNEYIDHLVLPEDFTNEIAASNMVKWLLK